MPTIYCGSPTCENEALTRLDGTVVAVVVSCDEETAETRPLCYTCNEAHASGAQYGRFRAVRRVQALIEQAERDCDGTRASILREALAAIDSVADPLEDSATPEDGWEEELQTVTCDACAKVVPRSEAIPCDGEDCEVAACPDCAAVVFGDGQECEGCRGDG